MKEQIDEINITLEMLEEKPLIIQYGEKKRLETSTHHVSLGNNKNKAVRHIFRWLLSWQYKLLQEEEYIWLALWFTEYAL